MLKTTKIFAGMSILAIFFTTILLDETIQLSISINVASEHAKDQAVILGSILLFSILANFLYLTWLKKISINFTFIFLVFILALSLLVPSCLDKLWNSLPLVLTLCIFNTFYTNKFNVVSTLYIKIYPHKNAAISSIFYFTGILGYLPATALAVFLYQKWGKEIIFPMIVILFPLGAILTLIARKTETRLDVALSETIEQEHFSETGTKISPIRLYSMAGSLLLICIPNIFIAMSNSAFYRFSLKITI